MRKCRMKDPATNQHTKIHTRIKRSHVKINKVIWDKVFILGSGRIQLQNS